ncbi:14252_t:CDS:10 [Entrophospora sp. SA101]|nr:14252_t:CDS:10 [Entrophospora sp. SA101]
MSVFEILARIRLCHISKNEAKIICVSKRLFNSSGRINSLKINDHNDKDNNNNGPLSGIRVVDLTRVLAGPYCTMLLGDLGAEVIKIENPSSGDDTRSWGPPWAKNKDPNDTSRPESAYFLSSNRNKKSITINLKSVEGVKVVKDLVEKSDIFVENYIPGKLDKLGIGYEQLNKINPRLIYTSITGYGQTGPYANRAGYDVIIEAEAGLMHITGEENGQPVKVGVAITDITTGLYAHGAIMAALLLRQPNQEAKRLGTSHPSIVPYQVFQTKDDFIMIGTGNEKQFKILCESIDKVELMHDERFKTNSDRVQNRKELIEILKERFQEHTTEHWLLVFEKNKHSIPFSSINNIHKTFQHPQIVARKMVQEVEHPKAGKIKLTGAPVKYSGYKPTIRLPPPILGQHTHEEFIRRD